MGLIDIARNVVIACDVLKISLLETKLTFFRNIQYRLLFSEARMLVTAHSLEKGMGLANVKKGYGKEKAIKLADALYKYQKKNPQSIEFPFIESLGILKAYIEYQINEGESIDKIQPKYKLIYDKLNAVQLEQLLRYSCGYNIVEKKTFLDDVKKVDFERFISTRRSVRKFENCKVDKADIREAIRLANYAPSACNRQPIKVYCLLGEKNAGMIKKCLSGNKAFTDEVNNFAVITAERAYFAGNEQYQWYVNGGIYLGYFVEALHSLGIGSCIMQWFAFSQKEKELKALLNINKTEAIIAIVCLGYYPEKFKCICAQRKKVEDMAVFLTDK